MKVSQHNQHDSNITILNKRAYFDSTFYINVILNYFLELFTNGLWPYLSICNVDSQVNVSKWSWSNFPDKLVFSTDYKFGFRTAATSHDFLCFLETTQSL